MVRILSHLDFKCKCCHVPLTSSDDFLSHLTIPHVQYVSPENTVNYVITRFAKCLKLFPPLWYFVVEAVSNFCLVIHWYCKEHIYSQFLLWMFHQSFQYAQNIICFFVSWHVIIAQILTLNSWVALPKYHCKCPRILSGDKKIKYICQKLNKNRNRIFEDSRALTVILRQTDSAIQSHYFSNDYMSTYKKADYILSILETLVENRAETTVKDDYLSFYTSIAKTDCKYALYSISELPNRYCLQLGLQNIKEVEGVLRVLRISGSRNLLFFQGSQW